MAISEKIRTEIIKHTYNAASNTDCLAFSFYSQADDALIDTKRATLPQRERQSP